MVCELNEKAGTDASCALRMRAFRFAGVSLPADALNAPPRPDVTGEGADDAFPRRRLQHFVRRLGVRR